MHPPLPVQGDPDRRRPRRGHSGPLRRLRHVREGLPGPRQEDPSRPRPRPDAARQRQEGLRFAGPLFRQLLQKPAARRAGRGDQKAGLCRSQRNRARRAGGQRRNRRVPRQGGAGSLHLQRLSGGSGFCEEIRSGVCAECDFGAVASFVPHQNFAAGVRRRYRRGLFRPLRRQEERVRPPPGAARPRADLCGSRRVARLRKHRPGPHSRFRLSADGAGIRLRRQNLRG